MYLFHITSGCLAPPSFRAQDFLLQMKNLHSTLHISEVLGFFFRAPSSGADFHTGVARTGPNSRAKKRRHLRFNGAKKMKIIIMKPHAQSSHKKNQEPLAAAIGEGPAPGLEVPRPGLEGRRPGPEGRVRGCMISYTAALRIFPCKPPASPSPAVFTPAPGCVYNAAVIRRDATGGHGARPSILPPRRVQRDPASRSHAKRQKRYFLQPRRSDGTSFAAIYN